MLQSPLLDRTNSSKLSSSFNSRSWKYYECITMSIMNGNSAMQWPRWYYIKFIDTNGKSTLVFFTIYQIIHLYIRVCRLLMGPSHRPSMIDVIDWWLSFKALILTNLSSSTVSIPNYKAQNIVVSTIRFYSTVLFSVILCFIILNIESKRTD